MKFIAVLIANVIVDLALIALIGFCVWHFNNYYILWALVALAFTGWSFKEKKD